MRVGPRNHPKTEQHGEKGDQPVATRRLAVCLRFQVVPHGHARVDIDEQAQGHGNIDQLSELLAERRRLRREHQPAHQDRDEQECGDRDPVTVDSSEHGRE